MHFHFVTLFPELIKAFMGSGVMGQGQKKSLLSYSSTNPREFTSDIHQSVDDRPFGGGDGMVMLAEPLAKAVDFCRQEEPETLVVYLSPQGQRWSDQKARALAERKPAHFTLVCGRYAGVDQRWIETHVDEEVSLGDFILSGGELAALAVADSLGRLVPGVLGNRASSEQDSFAQEQLLECPQFTRPREFRELPVPEFLLSGNHKDIEAKRRAVSLLRTRFLRPDLWQSQSRDEREFLQALSWALTLPETELRSLGLQAELPIPKKESYSS